MTIRINFFFAILCFLSSCQNNTKTVPEKKEKEVTSIATKANPDLQYNYKTHNLFGKVKSVTCTKYQQFVPSSELDILVTKIDLKFDKKGVLVEEAVYLQDNELNYRQKYLSDKMGNRILTESYDEKDSLVYRNQYTLNKQGLPVLVRYEQTNNPELLNDESRYKYETISDTLIVYYYYSKRYKDFSGNKTVKRYEKGNLVSSTEYKGKTIEKQIFYDYDERNNLIREDEKIGYSTTDYTYDKNNRVIHDIFYYKTTNRTFDSTTLYDAFGNIIKYERIDNGVFDNKSSYKDEFTYDAKNNWVKRERYKLNGTKISTLERRIEYYP